MTDRGGQLLIVSGPSGSGKTSIIERLRQHPQVEVSVNVTTRSPRQGEVHGRDYTFVDRDRFLSGRTSCSSGSSSTERASTSCWLRWRK